MTHLYYPDITAPSVVRTLACDSTTANSVTISWAAPATSGSSPVTSYDGGYRISGSTGAFTPIPAPVTSPKAITGLTAGTAYEIQVRAKSADGDGPYATVTCTTTVSLCARATFASGIPAFVTPTPTGTGVTRDVATYAQWVTAKAAAQPGDVIRITQTISGRNDGSATLKWQGSSGAPNGTAANPITITCAAGAEIVSDNAAGFPEALVLIDTEHVHVIGCNIRRGQFPFRYIASNGTAAAPVKLWHNDISEGTDASLYVGSAQRTGIPECSFVSVKYNKCHDALPTGFSNEGIYCGVGATAATWQDETHDIEIAYNEVFNHQGDGIDIKLGCYNINIHHNLIHDVGAHFGSGITTGSTNNAPGDNPNPGRISNYKVHHNWIYNVGYDVNGVNPGTNSSYGMYLARPGTECYNNIIWGLNPANDVRGISSVSHVQDSNQLIDIYNNTIWVGAGGEPLATGTAAGASVLNITYRNNLVGVASQGQTVVTAANFDGPVPVFQSGSGSANQDANAGDGAGSGFHPAVGATTIIDQATGVVPADDIWDLARPQGAASDRGAVEHCV